MTCWLRCYRPPVERDELGVPVRPVTVHDGRIWYYGQECETVRTTGVPMALPENQARWAGPRLARQWQCEVAAESNAPVVQTFACWRYNAETGDVEETKQWCSVLGARCSASTGQDPAGRVGVEPRTEHRAPSTGRGEHGHGGDTTHATQEHTVCEGASSGVPESGSGSGGA